MSSERLYYTDAYLVEFDALVSDVSRHDDRWRVTLDRTAFYPSSGGQPFDTGTLAGATVLDVVDQEDGTIGHFVDREIEWQSRVQGRINWDRRFDHMQQHTGQHLLSAAFERELGARTISFHLGSSSATIDLDKELSADQLSMVEGVANRVVWEDRDVRVRFVSAQEAVDLPLRKDPSRTGELRIVEIEDYDLSACGGTHVRRSGAIGMIAIAGAERFKGGLRVEFVCGGRALRAYRGLNDAISRSVRLLSVLPEELPPAIEKLQAASRQQQKSEDELRDRLAVYEAEGLASKGQTAGAVTLVAEALQGWDAGGLKKLASTIAGKPGMVAVLVGVEAPSPIVVARSQDVTVDPGVILKKLIERFGGKGGGKGTMAQGGGLSGDPNEMVRAAREIVSDLQPRQ